MDTLNNIILLLNSYLSDFILIIALLGCGLFFTIKLGGIQFKNMHLAFKLTFKDIFKKNSNGISTFQALAVSLAAQVGTGNVAGVATAIMAEVRELYFGCGLLQF